MNSVRQLGSGLVYAVVSVVLVVGGLSLALAEGTVNAPPPSAKPSPTLFLPSATVPPAVSTATEEAAVAASSTPQVLTITTAPAATQKIIVASPTASLRPLPTSTRAFYPTAVHCGPYSGWVKNYVVQPGDTLYHISTLYRTTVNALQAANCQQNTIIVPGELLWVPNVATSTPGVTIIPTFATPTETLTPPPATPIPALSETATPTPTDTSIPDP
jgi:LysM repeat protein